MADLRSWYVRAGASAMLALGAHGSALIQAGVQGSALFWAVPVAFVSLSISQAGRLLIREQGGQLGGDGIGKIARDLALGTATSLLGAAAVAAFLGAASSLFVSAPSGMPVMVSNAFAAAFICFLHLVYFRVRAADRALLLAQEQALRLQIARREAELGAMRTRLSPHFLFNALNSVAALARTDGARAYDACVALSEVLRETLASNRPRLVSLDQELAMVRNYLAVEGLRYGERLIFTEDVASSVRLALLPRLCLQPLLENAVRHGVGSMDEACYIHLHATRNAGRLEIRVSNDYQEGGATPGTGLGLKLAQALVEDDEEMPGHIVVSRRDGVFEVEVRYPLMWNEEDPDG